jgi:hypothetical protein
MYSATHDPNKPPTMTTGVLMVPEETMKAMRAEIERLREALAECADELEATIEATYPPGVRKYPSEARSRTSPIKAHQMTKQQLKQELKERGAIDGVCIRLMWKWLLDGEPVTRAANALLKSGEATASYYSGGRASLHLK